MRLLSLDTETELLRGHLDKVRTEFHVPKLACVSYAFETAGGAVCDVTSVDTPEKNAAIRRSLVEWLRSDYTICAHNIAFDLAVLAKHFGLEDEIKDKLRRREVLCTRILYSLRRPDGDCSRTLAAACEYVLGRTLEKGSVRTSYVPGEALSQEQVDYAKADAQATLDLATALLQMPQGSASPRPAHFRAFQVFAAERPGPDPDRLFSAAAGWLAFNIERVGLGVREERLHELLTEYERLEDEYLRELRSFGLADLVRKPGAIPYSVEYKGPLSGIARSWTADPVNNRMLRFTKKTGKYEAVEAVVTLPQAKLREEFARAADELGLRPGQPGATPAEGEYPVSESGQLSLDYRFWSPQRDELPEALRAYLRLGKARKLLSTYFRPLKESGATVVYPHVGIAFAETGRWAHYRPNLANQPKKIRDMYCAPPGYDLLVSADYKSLEMYTACEVMDRLGLGGGPLRKVLDSGGDVHRNTASMLFRKPSAEVTDAERQAAKVCFHPEVEVLTPRGWVAIRELAAEDTVAQYWPGFGTLDFAAPTAYIHDSDRDLVELRSEAVSVRMTPDHRVYYEAYGRPRVGVAADVPTKAHRLRVAGMLHTPHRGSPTLDARRIRQLVAIQADGSFSHKRVRFGFTKLRKVQRFAELFGVPVPEPVRGVYTFSVPRGPLHGLLDDEKCWVVAAVLQLPLALRQALVDEMVYWDGSQSSPRSFTYCSAIQRNRDAVQAAAVSVGRRACQRGLNVSIADRDWVSGKSGFTVEPCGRSDVYCVNVPSSFLLVRDKGLVSVMGNCNFSLLGGLGPRKFMRQGIQAGLDWDLAKATDIRARWFAAMTDCYEFLQLFRVDPWNACPPDWRRDAWLDLNGIPRDPWPSRWELQNALAGGAVYEIRLPSGRILPNRRFSQGLNAFFQGLGAEVISHAFNRCCDEGLVVCIGVHDSLTVACKRADADLTGERLAAIMKVAEQDICSCGVAIPLPEVTVGEVWS